MKIKTIMENFTQDWFENSISEILEKIADSVAHSPENMINLDNEFECHSSLNLLYYSEDFNSNPIITLTIYTHGAITPNDQEIWENKILVPAREKIAQYMTSHRVYVGVDGNNLDPSKFSWRRTATSKVAKGYDVAYRLSYNDRWMLVNET